MDSYKSLVAWKWAHQLCLDTLTATEPPCEQRTWAVFDQLRRAVVSVEANIVEGYALRTAPLFRRHLRIALGSAAEAECLLNIASEKEYLQPSTVRPLLEVANRTIGALYGLLRSSSL